MTSLLELSTVNQSEDHDVLSGSPHEACDVIVVGAGAGGLSCALRLAAAGKRVQVFEAMAHAGGKIGRQFHEGVEFDTGPSLLTMRDHLEELLEACHTSLERELEVIALKPAFRYLWPDGAKLEVHHELEATRASVRASFGGSALKEFDAFLLYSRRIWEAALPNFVEGEAPSFGSVLKLGLTRLREVQRIDPLRSMMQGIERHIEEPHLRDVMMRYATYNGSDALSAPATLNCIAWVELGLGGWGVRGGMAALPRALQRVGERLGVRFFFHHRVERVHVERGRVQGVRARSPQGQALEVSAPQVVVNADVAHLRTELLEPQIETGLPSTPQPSMSAWTGVIKARAREDRRAAHTVLFGQAYRREFEAIFERDALPEEPTVYLCDQRLSHKREGWPSEAGDEESGHVPVFVMANTPCEPPEGALRARSQGYWEGYREIVLNRARAYDLITAQDELIWERTPSDLAAQFPGSRGALYGAASNTQTAAFKRPPNRLKAIAGLYLASGSAHPGGGVPLCLLSGKRAAANALEDER